MKTLVPVLVILVAGAAFAQRYGGGPPPTTYGSVSGFGSVLYPGTGHPPVPYSGAGSLFYPGRDRLGGSGYGRGYRSTRGVVAAYPVFMGGYGYGYGLADPPAQVEQPQPPQTIVVQQPAAQAPAPTITINQYFRSDGPAGTTTTTSGDPQAAYRTPRQDDKPTIYLIAMKNHTIMPALGYWVEGDTLSYITSQGTKNSISLTLVDRDFSKQLNDERHVEFSL
jgi:hypothetical protein